MTGRVSDHDSPELAELRLQFRQAYPRMTATPENLGKYARNTGALITDFGQHSDGWKRLFERANSGRHPIQQPERMYFTASPPVPAP